MPTPLALARDCPICGRVPRVRFKHIFSTVVRLECVCGVAGQWRPWRRRNDEPWNDAAEGWALVVGGVPLATPRGTFRGMGRRALSQRIRALGWPEELAQEWSRYMIGERPEPPPPYTDMADILRYVAELAAFDRERAPVQPEREATAELWERIVREAPTKQSNDGGVSSRPRGDGHDR